MFALKVIVLLLNYNLPVSGESAPVDKNAVSDEILREDEETMLAHSRSASVFMGTTVQLCLNDSNMCYLQTCCLFKIKIMIQIQRGHGNGCVVAIGATTEFGRTFTEMRSVTQRKTPLQVQPPFYYI